jgi:hypothetical protein
VTGAAGHYRIRRLGSAGLAAALVSFGLTAVVALLGPSLMEPALPGSPGQPPWSLAAHPSPYLVAGLSGAAILTAVTGLAFLLYANGRGWSVAPRLVLLAGLTGALLLAFLPPFGSSDHLSYAAYGRMAVTGHNPFTTTPAMLARLGDPVARAVQDWRTSPSVYGSLAVGIQAFAAWIGGTSVRLIVFVLSLVNVAAFAATGLMLHWLARGDARRQLRAALLWTANPLLLMVLVAGEHVDSQAIVFGVAAVAIAVTSLRTTSPSPEPGARGADGVGAPYEADGVRASHEADGVRASHEADGVRASHEADGVNVARGSGGTGAGVVRPGLIAAAAGGLIGLGFAIKVTTALVGAGLALGIILLAWHDGRDVRHGRDVRDGSRSSWWRPSWRRPAVLLSGLAAGFAVVAGAALVPWGTATFGPALRGGSYTSIGSPWRAVRSGLRLLIGEQSAEDVVKIGALVLAVVLLMLLTGYIAHWPAHLLAAGGFAFVFAWLLAWPYVLPWYDGLGWALLALLPATRFDWLMLARTAALAIGYLPARGVPLPDGLAWLETVVRTAITPAALAVIVILAILWLRPGQRERLVPG